MGQETNAALRRKLRTQRAAYEELLGLAGAIMAALCVRRGDGGTLRLPKQDVHDALTRYEFAAAAEGEDYVLSYRHDREAGAAAQGGGDGARSGERQGHRRGRAAGAAL